MSHLVLCNPVIFSAAEVPGYPNGKILGDYKYPDSGDQPSYKFKVTRGDYSSLMALIVEELEKAQVRDLISV